MRCFIAGLVLTFGCASLDAALPLALLGKQIIQSIVQSLVEDAIHATLLATLGPCDGALASSALTNAQALLGTAAARCRRLRAAFPACPQDFQAAARCLRCPVECQSCRPDWLAAARSRARRERWKLTALCFERRL